MNLRQSINLLCITIVSSLWLAYCFAASTANPDDIKLINIHSNQAFLSQKRGQLIYQDHVMMTQGTRRLNANKLTILKNAKGVVSHVSAVGMPAKYQYQQVNNKQYTYIRADTINYNPAKKQFTFIKNVWFDQAGNTFEGDYSTYNTKTKNIRSKSVNHQSSKMILQPFDQQNKKKDDQNVNT